MGATVKELLALVEEAWPTSWALPEDRVGLQVGDPTRRVDRVLVALEASPAVVTEALETGAGMLLTHHPLLYHPAGDLREDHPQGQLLARVVRAHLAVASCHTNLDVAPDGLNAYLADLLGLQQAEVLAPVSQESLVKLVVFVPLGYEDRVRQAVMDDRVGVIGRYSHCSFAARGEGTFLPLEGARPFKGEVARLSRVQESRLEVLVPQSRVSQAVARLKAAHPYEEVAYDLYPLANPGLSLGFGRLGVWPEALSFAEAVSRVKEAFGVPRLRVWGRPPQKISRVAVCGGSGGDLIPKARHRGAQLYVTGEVRHHQAEPGPEAGFAILEVGHFQSEVVFMETWARRLAALFAARGVEVGVSAAQAEQKGPFEIL